MPSAAADGVRQRDDNDGHPVAERGSGFTQLWLESVIWILLGLNYCLSPVGCCATAVGEWSGWPGDRQVGRFCN